MKPRSRVNHPPDVEVPAGNRPVVAPIYQTVKFEFDSLEDTLQYFKGERSGFFYSRASNPTTRQLELLLAEMQGRDDCFVTSTGVGAIAQTLIALCRHGDHVLCFIETYSPTRYIIRRLLGKYGVTHTMLSIEDTAEIERVLSTQKTRLVFFESPTNPVTKIADIEAMTKVARAHGALTVLDNTFAGFHQHGEYDIDVFVHSLTKFASGTGDVSGGAVIARNEIMRALRADFVVLGGALDPHAAFMVQRGLKTYFVRYREQCQTAQRVAELLAAHPAVSKVHYPGLATHPQHALARKQMREFGVIVAFDVKAGTEAGGRFAESLELFSLTASLGSTESLVLAPQMIGGRDLSAEEQRKSGVGEGTVRLSIGLEDPDDLCEDVNRALEAASA